VKDLSLDATWAVSFYKILNQSANCILAERCEGTRARERTIWLPSDDAIAKKGLEAFPGLQDEDDPVEVSEENGGDKPAEGSVMQIVDDPPELDKISKPPKAKAGAKAKADEASWLEEMQASNGERIRIRMTRRYPTRAAPQGGYQITCLHCEPTVKFNKHGNEYKLACRRTKSISEDDDGESVLASLRAWAQRGPSYDDREKHKKDELFCKPKKETSLDFASSSECISRRGSDAEEDQANTGEEQFCTLCHLAHRAEECPLVREDTVALATLVLQSSTIQRMAVHGSLIFNRTDVKVRDVEADGDCMFHAFGKEVADKYPDALPQGYVASNTPGPYWRKFLLSYVEATDDLIDMVPVKVFLVVACEHHFSQ
jgi:hypothetical protein